MQDGTPPGHQSPLLAGEHSFGPRFLAEELLSDRLNKLPEGK